MPNRTAAALNDSERSSNRVVYVVMGWPRRMTNDRVAKLLQLRPRFRRMVLVVSGAQEKDEDVLAIRSIPNPLGFLRRIGLHRLRSFLERLVYHPNSHVLFSVVAKRRLLSRVREDLRAGLEVCVLTCAPNHENTSIGLYLKHKCPEVYWVIDWQDLWTYDENYLHRSPRPYRGALARRERRMLDGADMNVTTNRYAERVLREIYAVPAERLTAIHHHFDRRELGAASARTAALVPIRKSSDGSPITIGFLGTLFKPPRVPGMEFLDTLMRLRRRGIDVELHLHGGLPPGVELSAAELRERGLVLEPRIPHRDCVEVLKRYDFLLVLLADLPNSRAVMSIKLPQYLLTGRPILAVVPRDSAIADIVSRARAGVVVPADGDWEAALAGALRGHDGLPNGVPDQRVIDEFSWETISEEWSRVLNGRLRAG